MSFSPYTPLPLPVRRRFPLPVPPDIEGPDGEVLRPPSPETVGRRQFEQDATQAAEEVLSRSGTFPRPITVGPLEPITRTFDPQPPTAEDVRIAARKKQGEQFIAPAPNLMQRAVSGGLSLLGSAMQPIDEETGMPISGDPVTRAAPILGLGLKRAGKEVAEEAAEQTAKKPGLLRRVFGSGEPAVQETGIAKAGRELTEQTPPPPAAMRPSAVEPPVSPARAGQAESVPATTAVAAPPLPPPSKRAASTVNPEDFFNFRRVAVSPPEKENLRRLVTEAVQESGGSPKPVVTFQQIRDEAAAIHPEMLKDLDIKQGETLLAPVRLAMRKHVNTLDDLALKKSQQLKEGGLSLTDVQREALESEIDQLESDAKGLIDVLYPTRSQDGRNLAYHRIMADKSFDTEYWLSRARRKASGVLDPELERKLRTKLAEGRTAETGAGRGGGGGKDVTKIRIELADLMNQSEHTSNLDTLSNLWKAGFLTRPVTHIRNLGSSIMLQGAEEVARVPAAVADIGMSLFTKQREVAGPGRATIAGLRGATHWDHLLNAVADVKAGAGKKALRDTGELLKSAFDPHLSKSEMAKVDLRRDMHTKIFGTGTRLGKAGNSFLDSYVKWVWRFTAAGDRPARNYAFNRSLMEQAVSQAKTESLQGGLPARAVGERIKDLVDHPTPMMEAEAITTSEIAAFAHKSKAASALSDVKKALGKYQPLKFLSDLAIPYTTGPSNFFERIVEYLPLGNLATPKVAKVLSKGFTPEQQKALAMAWGRGTIGAAAIYAGWKLHEQGLLTGMPSDDPGIRAVDEAAGRVPGAILIDGKWRRITEHPIGQIMALAASMREESTRDLDDESKRPGNMAGAAYDVMMEQPMLRGLVDTGRSAEQPGVAGASWLRRSLGSAVPAGLSGLARMGDPLRRYDPAMTGALRETMPFRRELIPPRTDVLGETQEFGPVRTLFDPAISAVAKEKNDPLLAELTRLRYSIPLSRRVEGEQDPFTHTARQRWVGSFRQLLLRNTVQSPGYQQGDDTTRRFLLDRMSNVTGSMASNVENVLDGGTEELKQGIFQTLADPQSVDPMQAAEWWNELKQLPRYESLPQYVKQFLDKKGIAIPQSR